MDVVHTLKLKFPIKDGSETISELKFRQATAKDMGKLKMGGDQRLEDYFWMASRLTGQRTDVIEKLSPYDILEVAGYLGECMGDGQPTGEKPSA